MSRIELAYDDTVEGDTTLMLIHGAYGERFVYENQIEYFRSRYRVVNPDLRGHGESEKPDGPYSIPMFADDVAALCERLGVETSHIVGHSMGGVIAVELAHRHPKLVRTIATLDSPSIIPGWTENHMGLYTERIRSDDFREVLKGFLDVASSSADDPARRQQSLERIDSVPHHVVTAVWDAMLEWDPVPALQSLEVPLLYLDHGQPDLDYDTLRLHCPQLLVGQTVGAGHRALQEAPDQVNAMLDRFLTHAETLARDARDTAGSFRYQSE